MKSYFKILSLPFLLLLFISNIITWMAVWDFSKPSFLKVSFFDVGQGDAIFIQTPGKHQILIDGGPDSSVLEKLGRKMPFWDNTLDLIILTHPEKDHLFGLIEVLKRYRVENILWTGVVRENQLYEAWLNGINEEGAKIKIAQAGQRVIFGSDSKGFIDILYPLENLEGKKIEKVNNTSIVTKLIFRKSSFLFTGDAEKLVERQLVERGSELDSDVLKAGHHGSKTSTDPEFIKIVSPEVVIISDGKNNPYGHPHQETLDTLNKYAISVLRTDQFGDIEIFSDGKNLEIK